MYEIHANQEYKIVNIDDVFIPIENNIENQYYFNQILESLSSEAQEVINIILNTPKELLYIIENEGNGNWTKQSIKKYFIRYKLWKEQRIKDAFREIIFALNGDTKKFKKIHTKNIKRKKFIRANDDN